MRMGENGLRGGICMMMGVKVSCVLWKWLAAIL